MPLPWSKGTTDHDRWEANTPPGGDDALALPEDQKDGVEPKRVEPSGLIDLKNKPVHLDLKKLDDDKTVEFVSGYEPSDAFTIEVLNAMALTGSGRQRLKKILLEVEQIFQFHEDTKPSKTDLAYARGNCRIKIWGKRHYIRRVHINTSDTSREDPFYGNQSFRREEFVNAMAVHEATHWLDARQYALDKIHSEIESLMGGKSTGNTAEDELLSGYAEKLKRAETASLAAEKAWEKAKKRRDKDESEIEQLKKTMIQRMVEEHTLDCSNHERFTMEAELRTRCEYWEAIGRPEKADEITSLYNTRLVEMNPSVEEAHTGKLGVIGTSDGSFKSSFVLDE